MNASYVRDNNLYWAITLHKNRLYTTARKDNHANGNRSTPPTIHPFGMNTKVFFVVLQFYLWNKWPTRNSKIVTLRKEKQTGLKQNGSTTLVGVDKLRWSKPRLFATTVHFEIFIRIVTGCCLQQDLSHRQPHRFRVNPINLAKKKY